MVMWVINTKSTNYSGCAATVSHLHDSFQQPAQHISPFDFGPLHAFQLHNHGVYLGHDAADWVLHAVNSSHQSEEQSAWVLSVPQ